MHMATHAYGNACIWQRMHMATHAYGNTCVWQHMHMATHAMQYMQPMQCNPYICGVVSFKQLL